jgi:phosphoserine aminotransferase
LDISTQDFYANLKKMADQHKNKNKTNHVEFTHNDSVLGVTLNETRKKTAKLENSTIVDTLKAPVTVPATDVDN